MRLTFQERAKKGILQEFFLSHRSLPYVQRLNSKAFYQFYKILQQMNIAWKVLYETIVTKPFSANLSKGIVRNQVYETFCISFWNGFVPNISCETFQSFLGKGFVLNLPYETIFAIHQKEIRYETFFFRNHQRFRGCTRAQFLFWFRKVPFFFRVQTVKDLPEWWAPNCSLCSCSM